MIPTAYLVSRSLPDDRLAVVLDAALIHPVCCAVVFDYSDIELGRKLSENVVMKREKPEELIGRPSDEPVAFLVEQEAALTAVYPDGTREILIWPIQP